MRLLLASSSVCTVCKMTKMKRRNYSVLYKVVANTELSLSQGIEVFFWFVFALLFFFEWIIIKELVFFKVCS